MNTKWLWDLNLSEEEVRRILSNSDDPGFIRIAALLLSRLNNPQEVIGDYLGAESFCRNWSRIKREMRKNRWDEPRIIWWQAIYEKVYEKLKVAGFSLRPVKPNGILGPLYRDLGEQIRRLRKSQNISQSELAKKMGTSQQWVSLVERGQINLTLNLMQRISKALQTKLEINLK